MKFKIGDCVRYIGTKNPPNNALLLVLIGRTGVIKSASTHPEGDWFVRMDYGKIDLDAKECVLEKIDPSHRDDDYEVVEAEPLRGVFG